MVHETCTIPRMHAYKQHLKMYVHRLGNEWSNWILSVWLATYQHSQVISLLQLGHCTIQSAIQMVIDMRLPDVVALCYCIPCNYPISSDRRMRLGRGSSGILIVHVYKDNKHNLFPNLMHFMYMTTNTCCTNGLSLYKCTYQLDVLETIRLQRDMPGKKYIWATII